MKLASSTTRVARGSAPRSARRRLVKPLLRLATVAALFFAVAWPLDRPSSAAGPAGAAGALGAIAASPLGQLSRPAADRASIDGRVEERLPAGSYTYLAVRTDEALVWAVTLGDAPEAGARVKVRSMGQRMNFHSRRLERTFPELVFGIVSRAD